MAITELTAMVRRFPFSFPSFAFFGPPWFNTDASIRKLPPHLRDGGSRRHSGTTTSTAPAAPAAPAGKDEEVAADDDDAAADEEEEEEAEAEEEEEEEEADDVDAAGLRQPRHLVV